MTIDPYFKAGLSDVIELCDTLHVKTLYFFGSAINGKFQQQKSDLDILVDTDHPKSLVKLNLGLRKIYGLPVDIFYQGWALHPELLEYLEFNKIRIYPPISSSKLK